MLEGDEVFLGSCASSEDSRTSVWQCPGNTGVDLESGTVLEAPFPQRSHCFSLDWVFMGEGTAGADGHPSGSSTL